jgi:hypothetical protein
MRIPALMTVFAGYALAQAPSVQEIMAHVAESQAKSLEARRAYVYDQEELLRMRRTGGRLVREERLRYAVTPAEGGVHKELINFEGKYASRGSYVTYTQPGYRYKNLDLDSEFMTDFEGSTGESKALDGISHDYFPLTASEQAKYSFSFDGIDTVRGRGVYRIRFEPKLRDRHSLGALDLDFDDDDGAPWKGVALIDVTEYQPVRVTTNLAVKIPLAVKMLLGSDVKGLGFSISYERFGDGVWFPVSFGGEFEIRGLFLYRRTISISLDNKNFRHADVNSTVEYPAIQ